MLFDRTLVEGRQITVFQGTQQIKLEAPKSLWRCVVRLCDGTRTVNELLSEIPKAVDPEEFSNFVHFLINHEILLDGRLATARALAYANQMSPYGQPDSAETIAAIPRRFATTPQLENGNTLNVPDVPWMSVYECRSSQYTFDDAKSLVPDELAALLWASFGIVANGHTRLGNQVPHRTLASAGAQYAMRLYLVLRSSIGAQEPGVYHVEFLEPKKVCLKRLSDGQDSLIRAFVQPWNVQFCQGALFLAGDIELVASKYRNRATQYLFMEAGAALHNCALAAAQMGLGFSALGCYDEETVQALCETTHTVLASAVFGPLPSTEQITAAASSRAFKFAWQPLNHHDGERRLHVARVTLPMPHTSTTESWGMDQSPELAYRKACAEAVERLGWNTPKNCISATAPELAAYQHPDDLVLYHRTQYQRPGFPFQEFCAAQKRWWAPATRLGCDSTTWLPADLIYSRSSLVACGLSSDHALTYATTSGCAAAPTWEAAIEHGLHELVEHDAFMRHWLSLKPGLHIDPSTLPFIARTRLNTLRLQGCSVEVLRLDSDWAHVFLVWAQSEQLGFTTIGTAANQAPLNALIHALDELESRVQVWTSGHRPCLKNLSEVHSPLDHFELYGHRKHFHKADVLWRGQSEAISFDAACLCSTPRSPSLANAMTDQNHSPLIVDITPDRASIDLGRTPLVVIKAFMPGLLPMSFGYGLEPLGMLQGTWGKRLFPHPFP